MEWRAELTAAQLVRVRPGQTATVQLPNGATAIGTVRQLAPALDARNRTGVAYIDLDRHHAGSARAGMYATGALALSKRPGLAVPAAGVVVRDGHEYVFAVDADHRAVQTEVVTGRRQGALVELNSGLTENQPVVATGGAFLTGLSLINRVPSHP